MVRMIFRKYSIFEENSSEIQRQDKTTWIVKLRFDIIYKIESKTVVHSICSQAMWFELWFEWKSSLTFKKIKELSPYNLVGLFLRRSRCQLRLSIMN